MGMEVPIGGLYVEGIVVYDGGGGEGCETRGRIGRGGRLPETVRVSGGGETTGDIPLATTNWSLWYCVTECDGGDARGEALFGDPSWSRTGLLVAGNGVEGV
jgi:hypothetical protein